MIDQNFLIIARKILEFILNFFNKKTYKKTKPVIEDVEDVVLKSNWWQLYTDYDFLDEDFERAAKGRGFITKKNQVTLHFSGWGIGDDAAFERLNDYFTNIIGKTTRNANCTLNMHNRSGKILRILEAFEQTWTNGYMIYMDIKGRFTKSTNNMAITIEVAQNGNYKYGPGVYRNLAKVFHWYLRQAADEDSIFYKYCKDFKPWRVCGHEHGYPHKRYDPGKHFDWFKFLVTHVGISKSFFDRYLLVLDENKGNTMKNKAESNLKLSRFKQALEVIHVELADKPISYAFSYGRTQAEKKIFNRG